MAPRKTAGPSRADQLAGQLASLAPVAAADREPARRAAPAAMPAEAGRPEAYPARLPVKLPEDMKRALVLAHAEDGIEVSARVRAMIALWQEDPKVRARVDKLARTTGRPRHT